MSDTLSLQLSYTSFSPQYRQAKIFIKRKKIFIINASGRLIDIQGECFTGLVKDKLPRITSEVFQNSDNTVWEVAVACFWRQT